MDDVIIKDTEGHKHVRDMATYVAMPVFRWVEIFNLAGVEAPLQFARPSEPALHRPAEALS